MLTDNLSETLDDKAADVVLFCERGEIGESFPPNGWTFTEDTGLATAVLQNLLRN